MSESLPGGNPETTASPAPVASFEDAFSADASPASTPPDQSHDAAAAVQPATGQDSPQQDDRSPFIPRARFDEVLAARKAAEQSLEAWKGYEWARQVTPEQFRELSEWYRSAHADPVAFAQQLIGELQQHPIHGQALRSLAAKTLSSGRSKEPAPELPKPDVAITDEHGQVIGHTYSEKAQAQRDAWLTAQITARLEQRFQPMVSTVQQMAAERADRQRQAEAASYADGFHKELSSLPGFTEHAAAIKDELARTVLQSDHPAEVSAAAFRAYTKVVLPTLTQSAQSKLLDTLTHKAAASTGVNPGSAGPASSAKVTRFDDPSLVWR